MHHQSLTFKSIKPQNWKYFKGIAPIGPSKIFPEKMVIFNAVYLFCYIPNNIYSKDVPIPKDDFKYMYQAKISGEVGLAPFGPTSASL